MLVTISKTLNRALKTSKKHWFIIDLFVPFTKKNGKHNKYVFRWLETFDLTSNTYKLAKSNLGNWCWYLKKILLLCSPTIYKPTLNKANQTPQLNNKLPLNKADFFLPWTQICPDVAEKKLSMLYLRWLSCTNSYCQLIRSYLDSFKFSNIMDALSMKFLYINLSKINPKSTHQGYPPWGALALIRVWPWIKLLSFPLPLIKRWILNQY